MSQPALPLAPSLAQQLLHTARCVQAVEQGRSLADVLPQVAAPLRAGVQALTFHVLRHLGLARAVAAQLVQRKPEPKTLALLHSAVVLLLPSLDRVAGANALHAIDPQTSNPPEPHAATAQTPDMSGSHMRYCAHTVVDQTVRAAKLDRSTQRQAGFLNACLRGLLRDGAARVGAAQQHTEALWNHPSWWVQRLQHDHPSHWQQLLQANNQPGPMTLRVNRRQIARDAYLHCLQGAGLQATPVGEDGLVLDRARPVDQLPGFAEGQVSVQDAAAQLAAPLLLAGRPWPVGARVLDACAAPGGKTAHLLEHAELDLLALDVDPERCTRIQENLQRLGLRAQVLAGDAAEPSGWWDGRSFDAILLDAPCTASGIVRRHPDVRWLRRASDVDQLAATQRRLLEALWPLLQPGGRLVYATCSVFRAEGSVQINAFLERHTDAQLQPSPGHLSPAASDVAGEVNDNVRGGYDGFFYARLDKTRP